MCAQYSTWAICLFVYFFENWRLAFSKVCRTWPAHLELILYIGHKESQEESRDRSKLTSSRIFCLKMLHIICNFEYVSISALQWVDILTVTIILHNVDVLCSQTFLKRYCNHLSVTYLSSTLLCSGSCPVRMWYATHCHSSSRSEETATQTFYLENSHFLCIFVHLFQINSNFNCWVQFWSQIRAKVCVRRKSPKLGGLNRSRPMSIDLSRWMLACADK